MVYVALILIVGFVLIDLVVGHAVEYAADRIVHGLDKITQTVGDIKTELQEIEQELNLGKAEIKEE